MSLIGTENWNRELILEWAEALESGQYTQSRGSLHPTEDTYCCLGVACTVFAERAGIIRDQETGEWTWSDEDGQIERTESELPEPLAKLLFGDQAIYDPPLLYLHHRVSAINLNDDRQLTFPAIAEAIRNTLNI